MHVVIDPTGGPATVTDLEDLGSLDVRTEGALPTVVADSLIAAGLGSATSGHAWLDVAALRSAGADRGERWSSEFEQMIDFARDHGWVDGDRVRAHLS